MSWTYLPLTVSENVKVRKPLWCVGCPVACAHLCLAGEKGRQCPRDVLWKQVWLLVRGHSLQCVKTSFLSSWEFCLGVEFQPHKMWFKDSQSLIKVKIIFSSFRVFSLYIFMGYSVIIFFFFFFGGTGVRTQGLGATTQATPQPTVRSFDTRTRKDKWF
jgi:hypothetical protein